MTPFPVVTPATRGYRADGGTARHPADRGHRLRRRSPSPTPRGSRHASPLPVPASRRAGRARRPAHGGRERRPRGSGRARASTRRRRHRLLPDPLDELEPAVRRRRPRGCAVVRGCCARDGRTADRLSRRARTRPHVGAPRLEARGRRDPPRVGRPDDRVPGIGGHRLGQHVVRHAARAGRSPPAHDHAALGGIAVPADRDRRPAGLPHRGASTTSRTAARSSRSAARTPSPTASSWASTPGRAGCVER